jgi:hypothetical protein
MARQARSVPFKSVLARNVLAQQAFNLLGENYGYGN